MEEFEVRYIFKNLVLNKSIIKPFTLESWTIFESVDSSSLLTAIKPIAIIALAILVFDNALAVCFTIKIRESIIVAFDIVNPLPADESIFENSFNYCQVFKHKAASSTWLVVFPEAIVEAHCC